MLYSASEIRTGTPSAWTSGARTRLSQRLASRPEIRKSFMFSAATTPDTAVPWLIPMLAVGGRCGRGRRRLWRRLGGGYEAVAGPLGADRSGWQG